MKKIIYYLTFFALLPSCLIWQSCKKENPALYQSPAMIYVYKSSTNPYKDSIDYSFITKPITQQQDTVYIPVRIIGYSTSTDRVINLVADTGRTTAVTGVNYSFLSSYIIPKDSFSARLPVIVKRTVGEQTTEARLWVKLVNSADFKTGIDSQLTYLVKINDMVTKPADWNLLAGTSTYFGTWTNVKYRFIISVTGITDFGTLTVPPPGQTVPFTGLQVFYYKTQCVTALALYNANPANNPPLKDENGNIVTIP